MISRCGEGDRNVQRRQVGLDFAASIFPFGGDFARLRNEAKFDLGWEPEFEEEQEQESEPLMPLLITPGAAEALSVKIYRLVKVAGMTPLAAVQQCLDGYQNPVAAEVMDFQIGLAVKEASDLDFVPPLFREKR